jgi:predicted Zn-dependent protease
MKNTNRVGRFIGIAVAIALTTWTGTVSPASAMSIIRDAETENTIRDFTAPLFRQAGIEPTSVRIFVVNDRSLNAFVSQGNRMFVHTGLLLESADANGLIGVLAHETAHIAAGHLVQLPEAIERATTQSILALLLGGIAGVASGRGDVGVAIAGAGSDIAQRQFFGYTRGNEESADQAAMRYLDGLGISARGFLSVLETLEGQELLVSARQDPYMRTHPLSRARIDFVRRHVESSPYSDVPADPASNVRLERIKAKLQAFTLPQRRLAGLFKDDDNSVPARYGRAIIAHREARLDDALALMDSLLAEAPRDPYFHELRGQILFESQRARDALVEYERAIALLPDATQIRVSLAQIQIELNEPELLKQAVGHLNRALRSERRNAFYWRQLAIAYGRTGEEGLSSLALAEEAAIQGRRQDALRLAERATRQLPDGSPAQLRVRDLQGAVERSTKAR